jgi:FkbM family methyltransferase
MGYKRSIKRALEKLAGARIFRTLPRGVDLFNDIKDHLPQAKIATIFDVGANVGQSAEEFLKNFPAAEIYCFEPVEQTYRQLETELQNYPNVHTFQYALGAEEGPRKMLLEGTPDMFRLQTAGTRPRRLREAASAKSPTLEIVSLHMLDRFCQGNEISHIDLLKIDTEGGDLDVLRGAEAMIRSQEIDIIQVEAGMNSRNRRHVGFQYFVEFMEERGYFLFGIYEQMNEWIIGAPNLRRTNPVFISKRIIEASTATSPIVRANSSDAQNLDKGDGSEPGSRPFVDFSAKVRSTAALDVMPV